jgi:FkbM family methyltransferase
MLQNPTDITKYSQNDEQDYILRYFQGHQPSKFLDIGGFDPKALSNTRCLVEQGWSGVYVEPSPLCMAKFRTEYEHNPKIQLIEKAIALQTGTMEFWESFGDAVSTFDLKHKDKWSSRVQFKPIEVQTMTMGDLMDEYGHDVTCLSLDVEAMNYLLFLEIPPWFWDQCHFAVIEHDNFYQEMTRILSGFGFSKLAHNAENIVMGKI